MVSIRPFHRLIALGEILKIMSALRPYFVTLSLVGLFQGAQGLRPANAKKSGVLRPHEVAEFSSLVKQSLFPSSIGSGGQVRVQAVKSLLIKRATGVAQGKVQYLRKQRRQQGSECMCRSAECRHMLSL